MTSDPLTVLPAADFKFLIAAILPLDPYHEGLEPLIDELARIAVLNDQLNAAFRRVAERSDFVAGGEITSAHLAEDATAIHAFFEYVYYASPAFLSSVGEWPLGGARG
ncbi:hypothetical protein [Ancylobacter pratisalsi]|uniref:Gluconate 2-dehydrogenase subunit 3 family protein n=1 Tax=Ancylobacter pratisalsi TaxID=1745854 RepID=A0A6P1YR77_9HYPH|nr:hypothetical protein [Ancylobacter pratisalsi]QIB34553.1 hypothetical protein G3A50_13135 [Ancylobacter pratisalsi]